MRANDLTAWLRPDSSCFEDRKTVGCFRILIGGFAKYKSVASVILILLMFIFFRMTVFFTYNVSSARGLGRLRSDYVLRLFDRVIVVKSIYLEFNCL